VCKPTEKETKQWKKVSKKKCEKKYIILEQILGMVPGQQPTDQCTVSCRTSWLKTGASVHYRPARRQPSILWELANQQDNFNRGQETAARNGGRLRFKFFEVCEQQSC